MRELADSLWRGKPLKDMTREELYVAIDELAHLYRSRLEYGEFNLG